MVSKWREYTLKKTEFNIIFSRYLAGDNAAFAEFTEKFYTYIYNYILSKTKDLYTAEDLTQTLFVKLIRLKVKHTSNLHGYILTMASNMVKNYFKRTAVTKNIEFNEEIIYTSAASGIELAEVLDDLPRVEVILLKFKYLYGYNLTEIAAMLGMKPRTARRKVTEIIVTSPRQPPAPRSAKNV